MQSTLTLANVEIQNSPACKVTMKGEITLTNPMTCSEDTLHLSAPNATLRGAGFSGLNLVVDSNLTFASGTWTVQGKQVQIDGTLYLDGGVINLGGGTLNVTEDCNQKGGTLYPAGGTVQIDGNYCIAVVGTDSLGDTVYNTSSGVLYMNHPASLVRINGDFITASDQSHTDKLTAGTIMIAGDFKQISGNNYNFDCGGTLTVVLDGPDKQYITFDSTSSHFHVLQLTKDKESGYLFNPDPCWDELEEVQAQLAVLVQPVDYVGTPGSNATFTVVATGEGLAYQWQQCEPDQSQWRDIPATQGGQMDTLSVLIQEESDGRNFRCVITDQAGATVTTDTVTLNIKYALTLMQQPVDFEGKEGDLAIFSVNAVGFSLSYQWQYQNADSSEWRNSSMTENKTSTLVIPATAARNGQKYRCIIIDGQTQVISAVAQLTVQLPITNPLTDVQATDYFCEPVLWAYENNITSGNDETHFDPQQVCTRSQVVTFLWRANGCPEPSSSKNPFVDISSSSYYYKAVLWAYENEIATGVDSTHFAPNATVTRGQVVTFIWRAAGKPTPTVTSNPFVDASTGSYTYQAVLWAKQAGITTGVDATHFGIGNLCSRGQVVTFLYWNFES